MITDDITCTRIEIIPMFGIVFARLDSMTRTRLSPLIQLNRQHKMPLLARAPLMRTRVTAPARGYHVRCGHSKRRTNSLSQLRFPAPSVCMAYKQSRVGSKAYTLLGYGIQYSLFCCVVPDVSCDTLVST
jgi:hypothetical protein